MLTWLQIVERSDIQYFAPANSASFTKSFPSKLVPFMATNKQFFVMDRVSMQTSDVS